MYSCTNGTSGEEEVTYTYDSNDRLLTETDDKTGTADDMFTVYAYGTGNAGTQQTDKTVHAGLDNTGTVLLSFAKVM